MFKNNKKKTSKIKKNYKKIFYKIQPEKNHGSKFLSSKNIWNNEDFKKSLVF
jgi:hypothetical protein